MRVFCRICTADARSPWVWIACFAGAAARRLAAVLLFAFLAAVLVVVGYDAGIYAGLVAGEESWSPTNQRPEFSESDLVLPVCGIPTKSGEAYEPVFSGSERPCGTS